MKKRALFVTILALAGALLARHPVQADQRVLPESRAGIQLSFAPVVRKAAPAVVNIYAKKLVQTRRNASPLFNDPFFRRFLGNHFFGMPRERVENALGSGVIVGADGIVVTNNHVIRDATEVEVVLHDRRQFKASVLTSDDKTDLAVLKIDTRGESLPWLALGDSDQLEVGDLVLAIGNPFGVGQTVTSGIVSALARTGVGISDAGFFIQTDAAINPGNSGGALVTMNGQLAGINTAIYSRDGGSLGIGFAVPSNMVRTVVDAARGDGKIVRPWVGLNGKAVSGDIAESLGLDRPEGILVEKVHPDGPAAKAGIRPGDVIASVNGKEIFGPEALRYHLYTLPLGGRAELRVLRRGRWQDMSMRLVEPPENPPRNLTVVNGRNPFQGATIANLSPALANELGLDDSATGVIVTTVGRGSIAARLGVQPGDRVLQIGSEKVETVRNLLKLLNSGRGTWSFSLNRKGRVMQMRIRL